MGLTAQTLITDKLQKVVMHLVTVCTVLPHGTELNHILYVKQYNKDTLPAPVKSLFDIASQDPLRQKQTITISQKRSKTYPS